MRTVSEKILKLIPDSFTQISLEKATNLFLLECNNKNLSERTIHWYKTRIDYFIKFMEKYYPDVSLSSILPEHIKFFIEYVREKEHQRIKDNKLSTYTIKGIVMTLKIFFKFLFSEEYIKVNPAEKISTPKTQKKIIKTLSKEQIDALLSLPNKKTFTGFRNYVILLTFLDTGIRLNELINLKINQIDFSTNTFVVLGKGNKERRVPFGMSLRKTLEKYVRWRGEIPNQDILFVNQYGEKLKGRRIEEIIKKYGEKAKIRGIRVSPHTFRHTFAKMSLLQGLDAITLQYILGHTSLEMVRNYVNLTSQEVALQKNRFSILDKMEIKGAKVRKKIF